MLTTYYFLLTTFYHKVAPRREVHYLQAEVIDSALAEEAAEEIIALLGRRHRWKYEYKLEVMQKYIDAANQIINTVSWIGGIVARRWDWDYECVKHISPRADVGDWTA